MFLYDLSYLIELPSNIMDSRPTSLKCGQNTGQLIQLFGHYGQKSGQSLSTRPDRSYMVMIV